MINSGLKGRAGGNSSSTEPQQTTCHFEQFSKMITSRHVHTVQAMCHKHDSGRKQIRVFPKMSNSTVNTSAWCSLALALRRQH